MKNIIKLILLFAIVIIIKANAQEFEPNTAMTFTRNLNTVTLNQVVQQNTQSSFTLGWQWFGHPKMTESLFMNSNQGQNDWGPSRFDFTCYKDLENKENIC